MTQFLASIAALSAFVWGSTEAIAAMTPSWATKRRLAFVLGPFAGVAAHGAGVLEAGTGGWGYVFAALTGLMGTLGAAGIHAAVVKPLKGE